MLHFAFFKLFPCPYQKNVLPLHRNSLKYSNIWSETPEFTYIYGFVKSIMQLLTI